MNFSMLSQLLPDVALWKKDLNHQYTMANAKATSIFGYSDVEDIIGMTDENHPCKIAEYAHVFQSEDQNVIHTKTTKKFIEIICCANDEWRIFLVTKIPDINDDHRVQGTFASCVDITNVISKFGLLLSTKKNKNALLQKSFSIGTYDKNLKLSEKQTTCLFYLLRGKTAKEIGGMMGISHRTVEEHIQQLKYKFDTNKKSELIEKALSNNFHLILPEFLLKEQSSINL